MERGEYKEQLPFGGYLKVTDSSWMIEYYFPGPDRRYNGTFYRIGGDEIDAYIQAYMTNWDEYQRLKRTIPADGEFTQAGLMDMTIRIGGFREGVCVAFYHLPIASRMHLDELIAAYKYAKTKGPVIQQMLASI